MKNREQVYRRFDKRYTGSMIFLFSIMGILMIAMEKGDMSKDKVVLRYIKYIFIGLAVGTANGLFGSGGGTIAVPAMILLLGADDHRAHATAIAIILPLTMVSSFFYISDNFVDWSLTLKVALGGLAGGYIGARLLQVFSSNVLRRVFAVFMMVAGVRMMWG